MEKELLQKMQEKAQQAYPCTSENPCADREKYMYCNCDTKKLAFTSGANALYSEIKDKINYGKSD